MNQDNGLNIYNFSKNLENNPIEVLKRKMYGRIKENMNEEINKEARKNSDISMIIKSDGNINKQNINFKTNSIDDINSQNNNKNKPTGINLFKVLINDINIEPWEKLIFKIHYGKKQFVIEFDQPKYEDGPKYKCKIEISFEDIKDLLFFTNDYKIKLNSKNMRIYKESKLKKNGLWEKGNISDIILSKGVNKPIVNSYMRYELRLLKEHFHKFFSSKNNIVLKIESMGLKYRIQSKISRDNNSKNYLFELKHDRFLMEFETFEKDIKGWNIKQKADWIKKTFNIPNFKFKSSKQLFCPIFSCNMHFNSVNTLKSHISKIHNELTKNGLEYDSNGNLNFKNPNNIFEANVKTMLWFKELINKKILPDAEKIINKK